MKNHFKNINKPLFKEAFFAMLFSFLVLGVVSLISLNLSFFKPFENAFKDFSYLDLYYAEKLDDAEGDINQNIVLVNINRLERSEIAKLINKLKAQKPSVIGLDVIFKQKKDSIGDQALAQSLQGSNMVVAYEVTNTEVVKSISAIVSPDNKSAYTNFSFDPETAVARNFQGYRKNGDSLEVAFGTAISKMFLKDKWQDDWEAYLLKERPINFKGNRDNFLVLEYQDVMNLEEIPLVKDHIVLLGYLGDELQHEFNLEDKHFTPMNSKFVGKSAPDTFGLVVHANIINMIITDNFIKVVPNWFLVFLTIVLTFIALAYFIWLAKRQLASYILRLNIIRLAFMVVMVWIALLLFRSGVLLKTAGMIAVVAFSVGLIGYYKKLAHMLYKKFKWNGYFYHD